MEPLDPALMLARYQFAFTISFHIVLAAFSIGLANYLMVLEALWLWRKRQVYRDLYTFWLKIFAWTVAVGTASGLVMEFQFGTNWGALAHRAGAILGPLMFYEVMVAFFLEAGFIGVMLFGMNKVGPRLHFLSTCAVAVGSLFSAFWILSANSWMHTPAGFSMAEDGRFVAQDWLQIIFNPSFPYRMVHMSLAAFLGTAMLVGGAAAWHLVRNSRHASARVMFSMALWMAALVGPLQIVAGDLHGENTRDYQPQKLAAIEGSWQRPEAGKGEPLRLFAIPDQTLRRNDFELAIPHLGSLYLRHDWTGTIQSLDEFAAQDIPPVAVVFYAFRIMVGIGLLIVALGIASLLLRWRGGLFECRWLLRCSVLMAPAGFVAMLCGWIVTEVGRQPFTVYGLMRTVHSHSQQPLSFVAGSTLAIMVMYGLVFGLGLLYLVRAVRQLPAETTDANQ
ncbi:cytochrome bd-I ubiquinol oxidase subunit 1 apoprotein [Pseudomonas cedrina]|uniref:Cytochrome ubiquinol oxidase subunit I n=2 Tax=Pseudomonas cedrina TaxID=651740 RepID=A0A1V2JZ48_PSECE|nr:cytochrome ubiquinol oxidase subunit I [Pseudomonas cedrina]ONH50733.1 cytochrome ubiquinol oxidase subunit I [Pseudomonas cedrina subsp. cedrina]SDS34519.1 cytochrome bd-I ubiquinol oxidase subunit 1 apoprotein [Pseudomonas cedrina]